VCDVCLRPAATVLTVRFSAPPPPPAPLLFPYATLFRSQQHLLQGVAGAQVIGRAVTGRAEHGDERFLGIPARGADELTERALGSSEEHTSELQSRENLVCRLLLEKNKPLHPGDPHVPPN